MSDRLGLADCEAVRQAVVAQPVSATTSLAFVAGSLVVLARGGGRSAGVRVYAATMAAVGVGSWWYHGPQGTAAEVIHDATIGVLLAEAAAVPVLRRLRGRAPFATSPERPVWAWTAIGLLGLAGGAYVLGRTGSPLCHPESLLQAHGLWHLLAAGAFTAWGGALWTQARST